MRYLDQGEYTYIILKVLIRVISLLLWSYQLTGKKKFDHRLKKAQLLMSQNIIWVGPIFKIFGVLVRDFLNLPVKVQAGPRFLKSFLGPDQDLIARFGTNRFWSVDPWLSVWLSCFVEDTILVVITISDCLLIDSNIPIVWGLVTPFSTPRLLILSWIKLPAGLRRAKLQYSLPIFFKEKKYRKWVKLNMKHRLKSKIYSKHLGIF